MSIHIEDGFIATGVQALLALAGEACTPAISNRLDNSLAGTQTGDLGVRRRCV
ncbi:MAG: hypothetical protein Q7U66_13840 [Methylobacter sp.]|nr:hypothetical protein [Methylobacter sp.]